MLVSRLANTNRETCLDVFALNCPLMLSTNLIAEKSFVMVRGKPSRQKSLQISISIVLKDKRSP